jgi:hypothetical protein
MQPEIRVAVFRAHSYCFLKGEVDTIAQGREELLIEGTWFLKGWDGYGDAVTN